ncbi:peroxiredoxin family protein [Micromonospora chokoriensis]
MGLGYGITGRRAPELRVPVWLDGVNAPVRIADVREPVIYMFSFQAWCRGCHLHGFPTLLKVRERLRQMGRLDAVKFIVVQTAFEGFGVNTAEKTRDVAAQYDLTDIDLGHDAGNPPTLMADYRAGGTPWTVIIGPAPDRLVHFDGFHLNPSQAVTMIEKLTKNAGVPGPVA